MELPQRPRLVHRALRRSAGALQLGLGPTTDGVVLEGLEPGEVALIERLDGTLPLPRLYAAARDHGLAAERVDVVLRRLAGHGLLAPELDRLDVWHASRRTGPHTGQFVLVDGSGPLPRDVAVALRACGVGRVDLGSWAHDDLDLALRADAERPDADVRTPDVVVLPTIGALDPRRADPWRRRAVAHLPVVVHPQSVTVGPLVTGLGRDPQAPCLHCVDLHRADRDPSWPAVLAQACPAGATAEPVQASQALALAAAGLVVMIVAAHLWGRPLPLGVSVELSLPWPRLDHRRWPRHPSCPGHEPDSPRPAHEVPAHQVPEQVAEARRTRPVANGVTITG